MGYIVFDSLAGYKARYGVHGQLMLKTLVEKNPINFDNALESDYLVVCMDIMESLIPVEISKEHVIEAILRGFAIGEIDRKLAARLEKALDRKFYEELVND